MPLAPRPIFAYTVRMQRGQHSDEEALSGEHSDQFLKKGYQVG